MTDSNIQAGTPVEARLPISGSPQAPPKRDPYWELLLLLLLLGDSNARKHATEKGQQWGYNTGNNDNSEGKQKTGNVRIGNQANESKGSSHVTHSGSINTGGNTNRGKGGQETGNVEIGNVG